MLRNFAAASALAALLSACGGGTDPLGLSSVSMDSSAAPPPYGAAAAIDPIAGDDTAATTAQSCSSLAPLPTVPATARSIASFGVAPSETKDNTAAIQAALDALKPGDWLVFPAGKYLQSKSLRVRVPGVVLWGDGATLVATNPSDTSILLQADGIGLYKFRLHAVTTTRGSTPQQSRIAIFPAGTSRVRNVIVRRNIIENGGAPGTPLANGSSATGIMVYRADGFLVAENYVKRTLADGIHVTGGSINGRVIKNLVRENGDDMISVVSYMGSAGTPISTLLANLTTLRAEKLARNIVITGNDVDGQYWGRGIAVVGGESITIENNRITNVTYGAGVLLAHESGYVTFGVRDVIVRNNTIQHVQTTAPAYSVGAAATAPRTGHAGIELHSLASSEELADPTFARVVAVETVRVENNAVDDTLADGVRVGVGGGKAGLIGLLNNPLSSIRKTALNIRNSPTPAYNTYCSGNRDDGNATSANLCMGANPPVTGATLDCAKAL